MNEIERICNSHMSKERKIQELIALEGLFYALLITALVDTAALITVSSTLKDMYNRKIYNEEISSYQRRLK